MPATDPIRVPLSQLQRGDRAVVNTAALDSDESQMLYAMGLREGSEVTVCRAGRNCIVQVQSTRLGICRRVAQRIMAVPCQCATADDDATA